MNFLIIGNSAAGTAALEAIRKFDRKSSVTIISDENYPLYSRCLLPYFLADSIDEAHLLFRPRNYYKKLDAEVILGKKVEAVLPASQQVVCDNGTKLDYDKLLIATGSSPKVPINIPKEMDGVFVLRTIADAVAIKKKIRAGRNAVVLGGGLIGLKVAFALNRRGLHVTVVVRSRHVLSQMIDYDAAQIVMRKLRENGIGVLTGSDVTEVETRAGKLVAVKIEVGLSADSKSTERVLPCDMLIVAKGIEPNMGLIGNTSIDRNQGILTDARMQTTIENIYAAGDVAETFDIATEQSSVNALWACAVQQGKIAGFNMIRQNREYDGSLGLNSINFPGADLISFGVVRPKEDGGYEVLVDSRPQSNVYKKLVLKDNKIKGLILVNRIDNAGVLLTLLGRKINVVNFKDELLSDRCSYAQVLGSKGREELFRYWSAARALGKN